MLKNKSISLRALEPYDIETLYEWENSTDLWRISSTSVPISKHQLELFVQESSLGIYETKQLRLMIESNENKKAVGCIDLFDFEAFHKRAGIGILIFDTRDRQKGVAFEALTLLIDYAFNFLELHQLYCNILIDNQASINLFKKAGFSIVAQKKEWFWTGKTWKDEYFLQKLNEAI